MPTNAAPIKASANCEPLKKLIREVPDFPKKGILFYDITTVLKDKRGFAILIDGLSEHYVDKKIDLVLGMEARGFIFAPTLAYRLNAGFVPVRKPGSFPRPPRSMTTRWNMVRTRSRFTKTPSRRASASLSWTTC